MPANAVPKEIYKFPNYIMGPRSKRTYLDDGNMLDPASINDPASPINSLMLNLNGDTSDTIPVEEYKGLPDYVRDQGFDHVAPERDFSGGGTGAQLLSAGDYASPMPPDMLDGSWRSSAAVAPPATPQAQAIAPDKSDLSDLPAPFTSALDKEKGMYESYPVQQQPKWWQRAAGAAFGFGAGMANAGHIRQPIDINGDAQNILYPGYAAQVAQWRSQLLPVQAEANIEGQRQAAALKQEQMEGQKTQREATAAWRNQLADPHYGMQQIAPDMGQAHGIMPDKDGNFWVQKNVAANLVRPGPPDKSLVKQWTPQEAAAATSLGLDPNSIDSWPAGQAKQFFDMTQKQPGTNNQTELELAAAKGDPVAIKALDDENKRHVAVAQASRPAPDPAIAAMRQDRLEEMQQHALDEVGNKKIQMQNQVLQERNGVIQKTFGIGGMPAPTEEELWKDPNNAAKLQSINAQFAPRLQAIEDQYASAGTARGVPVQRQIVDPRTLAYSAPPPPAIVAKLKQGQAVKGPDGKTWTKQADGSMK